ncbi:tetratricopeptide repeat protein [Tengunoibacter tsumagoiensis]|uniref:Peptidase C14 caspase domain-containing protein n=1 Tax=Tengunoibacter tsumagoiensis TaxID=2014871 RepID=A0A402A0S1_9CHLR|nr:tetratricopeptide repeat protein [Tengunoibacter tsumagoiensis]GCE12750.1 hypothetical protein KTT_26090 [Tengunoibacter tsumagoiensis]
MYSGKLPIENSRQPTVRHLGLIIGVNQYQDPAFQTLHYAENDARALAQWLVNSKGGKWAPPDVQLIQGQHATRELLEGVITQICLHKAEPGDSILIYFAGHALVSDANGEGYLALTNSRANDPTTCLHLNSFVQQVLAASKASHILCMIDCFQNGQMWQMRRSTPYDSKPLLGPNVLGALQKMPDRLFMCSCRGNERAPETGERGLGFLAHRFILGVCGPAQEAGTGNILLPTLHSYLFANLSEQQRPQLFGQQTSPLLLVGTLASQHIAEPAIAASPASSSTGGSGLLSKAGLRSQQTTGAVNLAEQVYAATGSTAGFSSSTTDMLMPSSLDSRRQQQCQQLIERAQQFFQAQNFGEAFNLAEQALHIDPTYQEALILKAQLLGTAGRYQEALLVVDQMGQSMPTNPIAWSMRAVLLSNVGQHQAALAAIERSLELDAQNPESYVIKNTITANIALGQSQAGKQSVSKFQLAAVAKPQSARKIFFSGIGLHLLGLVVGSLGAILPLLSSHLSPSIGNGLMSIGLALICVSSAISAFRRGLVALGIALLHALFAGIILGLVYLLRFRKVYAILQGTNKDQFLPIIHSQVLPLFMLVLWLAMAVSLPFLITLVSGVAGAVTRARRKKQ